MQDDTFRDVLSSENPPANRQFFLGYWEYPGTPPVGPPNLFRLEQSPIVALSENFPPRPEQKPGEFLKDYDSRTLRYLAECRSEHVPTFQRRAEAEAKAMGFRFVLAEVKDEMRTVVISYPPEVDPAKLSQYMAGVRNYFPPGTEVRAVAFPYR